MKDKSSPVWAYVFPAGLAFIFMAALISRFRNKTSGDDLRKLGINELDILKK